MHLMQQRSVRSELRSTQSNTFNHQEMSRVVFHMDPPMMATPHIQWSLVDLEHLEKLNKLVIDFVEVQICRSPEKGKEKK